MKEYNRKAVKITVISLVMVFVLLTLDRIYIGDWGHVIVTKPITYSFREAIMFSVRGYLYYVVMAIGTFIFARSAYKGDKEDKN